MRLARRAAAALAVLVILALAGLGVLWFQETAQVKAGLEEWVAARRSEGYKIDYSGPTLTGFPFAVRVRLEHPEIADANSRWRWQGDAVEAEAQSWSLTTILIHPQGRQELAYLEKDGRIMTVAAMAAKSEGVLALDLMGQPSTLHVTAEQLTLEPPAGKGQIKSERAEADLSVPRAPDATEAKAAGPALPPSLMFDFRLAGVTLPETSAAGPLGAAIETVAGRGEVDGVIMMGTPATSLAAWRDAGGTLEFKSLELVWGPLRLQADATVALDSSMQPEGAGTAEIRGYAETIDALVAREAMKPTDGSLAKTALSLLARRPPGGGEKVLKVALRLEKRLLYAGPVGLLRLPAITWPQ